MGCLRNIIKLIVICLAIIGFLSIGGKEYLETNVMPTVKKVNVEFKSQLEKTGKKFTELSLKEIGELLWNSIKVAMVTQKITDGYEITEVKGLMGYDTQIAEDLESGQKMVTVNTKDKILLDINTDDKAELKADMMQLAKKHKALPIKSEDIDVVEIGNWNAMDKDLRYAKISIKDPNSDKEIFAIVSSYPDGKTNKMIVTFAEKNKFSKQIAEKYFKKGK